MPMLLSDVLLDGRGEFNCDIDCIRIDDIGCDQSIEHILPTRHHKWKSPIILKTKPEAQPIEVFDSQTYDKLWNLFRRRKNWNIANPWIEYLLDVPKWRIVWLYTFVWHDW